MGYTVMGLKKSVDVPSSQLGFPSRSGFLIQVASGKKLWMVQKSIHNHQKDAWNPKNGTFTLWKFVIYIAIENDHRNSGFTQL